MQLPIYLDYQATTPVDPRVLEAMLPYFQQRFGNASSKSHRFGWEADAAVKAARAQCAAAIGARPEDVVFTSGSTEAINLALKGLAQARPNRPHLVTCVTEHSAVLEVAELLEERGGRVTRLPVDGHGRIDLRQLEEALTDDTLAVAIMTANNEIGTRQPTAEIGARCRARGVPFFTDATQGVGRFPIDVDRDGIDLLAFSGHKLYGPKGVGVLYVRRDGEHAVQLRRQSHGGGQEHGLRAGTLNVPGIVGIGKACELALAEMSAEAERLTGLRERLWNGLSTSLDRVHRNGHPTERLPGNLNVTFEFVAADALLMDLKDVAISSGSACGSGAAKPSHVLTAIGIGEERARSSVRFGLGRMTTEEEIDFTVEQTVATVRRLRELSPMYELAREADEQPAATEQTH